MSSEDYDDNLAMDNPLLHSVLGSATAGILSRVLTHPLDTAKARLQAPPGALPARPYRGPADALARTARAEGVRGLYRGFGAVMVGGTPGTVIYLCGYESIRGRMTREGESAASGWAHLAAGMLAEAAACVIYVPVDVIKERLQVQHRRSSAPGLAASGSDGGVRYRGSYDALRKILRTEGLGGIYKGCE